MESYRCVVITVLTETQKEVSIQLTISLGVSSLSEGTDSELSLLRNADRVLYIAGKQTGLNRVGNYEGELRDPIQISFFLLITSELGM